LRSTARIRHVDLEFYADVLRKAEGSLPDVHLKFYTASEIHHMSKLEGCTHDECSAAEGRRPRSPAGRRRRIFRAGVRQLIAPGKEPAEDWFHIHDTGAQDGDSDAIARLLWSRAEAKWSRARRVDLLRQS